MGKSFSVTVYPAADGAEYLSVADAMRQVLDVIDALEQTEAADGAGRQIVWRLLEAHTHSPPFTVTAGAFSVDPIVSVALQAERISAMFYEGVHGLLEGQASPWIDARVGAPLKRVFQRNQNGIGRTAIDMEGGESFDIVPGNAQTAAATLDSLLLAAERARPDYTRTEYGSIEAELFGIIRWNEKPALTVVDRLSEEKVTCVLSENLAARLGPEHKWLEAWDGHRILITGALHYGKDGALKKVDAIDIEDMPWADVTLNDLRGIDILQGATVAAHLAALRGEQNG